VTGGRFPLEEHAPLFVTKSQVHNQVNLPSIPDLELTEVWQVQDCGDPQKIAGRSAEDKDWHFPGPLPASHLPAKS
jgi:hypothetical protein